MVAVVAITAVAGGAVLPRRKLVSLEAAVEVLGRDAAATVGAAAVAPVAQPEEDKGVVHPEALPAGTAEVVENHCLNTDSS